MNEQAEGTAIVSAVRDEQIAERVAQLRAAVDAGAEYFGIGVAERARRELDSVADRARVGAGITVAALAGGTGSGKSTLFNAITGLNFADPGDLRPTTEEATACTYNVDATHVLDMLGVRPSRRIAHGSLLTAGDDSLDSLVLLDLPDHDSVHLGNSALVDRTLPLVDVLIWVLDPQKYADHLIHEGYLRAMRARREHMIVLLNQIDTVPEAMRNTLIDDVRRLLREDGLEGVAVYAVSGRERQGLDPVIEALREVVEAKNAVASTAHAELEGVRRRLAAAVGTREADMDGRAVKELEAAFIAGTGIPSVMTSLEQAGKKLGQSAIARADQPAASMTNAAREAWVTHATQGLPELWQEAVRGAVPDAEKIRRSIGGAVRAVVPPKIARVVPTLLVLAGLAAVGAGIASFSLLQTGPVRNALIWGSPVAAVFAWCCAWHMRRSSARRASEAYERQAHRAVEDIVRRLLVAPVRVVLARHREVRESLSA